MIIIRKIIMHFCSISMEFLCWFLHFQPDSMLQFYLFENFFKIYLIKFNENADKTSRRFESRHIVKCFHK